MSELRLLVLTSKWPAHPEDGTPPFVSDLTHYLAPHFQTLVITQRIPQAPKTVENERLRVERFAYFPERWERLADGAILENLRSRKSNIIQAGPLVMAEALAVRRAVHRFRPHVIHAHWIVPQGIVAVAAARGIPLVVTTLGADLYALRGRFWRWVQTAVLNRAFAITTQNAEMRERLLEIGGDPERVRVMPLGANVELVKSSAAGTTASPGRIVFAGRLVEKKGVHVLLRALRHIPSDLDWSLDVVGDGPMRSELERAASGLPVRFMGMLGRRELLRVVYGGEIFVVPSVSASSGDQDGLPLVLLEAMAAGRAIVASRLPGIGEAVEDARSGVLVNPGDEFALGGELVALLKDRERRIAMGSAARERADDYSVDVMGPQFADLLRSAARR